MSRRRSTNRMTRLRMRRTLVRRRRRKRLEDRRRWLRNIDIYDHIESEMVEE